MTGQWIEVLCQNLCQLFCGLSFSCEYRHGDLCEMCGKECLSPFDPEQRKGML